MSNTLVVFRIGSRAKLKKWANLVGVHVTGTCCPRPLVSLLAHLGFMPAGPTMMGRFILATRNRKREARVSAAGVGGGGVGGVSAAGVSAASSGGGNASAVRVTSTDNVDTFGPKPKRHTTPGTVAASGMRQGIVAAGYRVVKDVIGSSGAILTPQENSKLPATSVNAIHQGIFVPGLEEQEHPMLTTSRSHSAIPLADLDPSSPPPSASAGTGHPKTEAAAMRELRLVGIMKSSLVSFCALADAVLARTLGASNNAKALAADVVKRLGGNVSGKNSVFNNFGIPLSAICLDPRKPSTSSIVELESLNFYPNNNQKSAIENAKTLDVVINESGELLNMPVEDLIGRVFSVNHGDGLTVQRAAQSLAIVDAGIAHMKEEESKRAFDLSTRFRTNFTAPSDLHTTMALLDMEYQIFDPSGLHQAVAARLGYRTPSSFNSHNVKDEFQRHMHIGLHLAYGTVAAAIVTMFESLTGPDIDNLFIDDHFRLLVFWGKLAPLLGLDATTVEPLAEGISHELLFFRAEPVLIAGQIALLWDSIRMGDFNAVELLIKGLMVWVIGVGGKKKNYVDLLATMMEDIHLFMSEFAVALFRQTRGMRDRPNGNALAMDETTESFVKYIKQFEKKFEGKSLEAVIELVPVMILLRRELDSFIGGFGSNRKHGSAKQKLHAGTAAVAGMLLRGGVCADMNVQPASLRGMADGAKCVALARNVCSVGNMCFNARECGKIDLDGVPAFVCRDVLGGKGDKHCVVEKEGGGLSVVERKKCRDIHDLPLCMVCGKEEEVSTLMRRCAACLVCRACVSEEKKAKRKEQRKEREQGLEPRCGTGTFFSPFPWCMYKLIQL